MCRKEENLWLRLGSFKPAAIRFTLKCLHESARNYVVLILSANFSVFVSTGSLEADLLSTLMDIVKW